MARDRLRIGRGVERLQSGCTRVRAGSDVPDGVAAGLARGQARLGEDTQGVVGLREVHEVELDILARRDVAATGGQPLGDVRQRSELRRREDTLGDLDADHHRVALLALAVDAVHQAELFPRVGGDLTALELAEHRYERIQVLLVGEPETGGAERLAIEQRHVDLLRVRCEGGRRERRWSRPR